VGIRGLSIQSRTIEIFNIRERDMPALRSRHYEAEKRLKKYLGEGWGSEPDS
jgi:hypothetical protein